MDLASKILQALPEVAAAERPSERWIRRLGSGQVSATPGRRHRGDDGVPPHRALDAHRKSTRPPSD